MSSVHHIISFHFDLSITFINFLYILHPPLNAWGMTKLAFHKTIGFMKCKSHVDFLQRTYLGGLFSHFLQLLETPNGLKDMTGLSRHPQLPSHSFFGRIFVGSQLVHKLKIKHRKQLKCEKTRNSFTNLFVDFCLGFFCCCLSWLQIQLLEMLTNRQKSSQDPYLALASKPNFKLKDDVAGFEGLALRPLKAAAEVAESAVGAVPPKASSYQALT